ncbi:hypothetical protein YYG_00699 [Plasmodium vinckei petteri]|uniref:PIR protein CIR protein n=1 Tax=Plasmodium vinckei petteri TaxID=138298 RepID=W7B6N0_PLAVN|nr:hypothetical protein YYG_00699 [Plasmodium vinckei petteri]
MVNKAVSIYFLIKTCAFTLFECCTIYKLLLNCISETFILNKFNNSGSFTYKCPRKASDYKCTTNNKRINTLRVHLYQKLTNIAKDFKGEGDNGNRHIEIFIMWLRDKLFKIDNEYKKALEESYKKYLENSMPSFSYWSVINSKSEYKVSNNLKKIYDGFRNVAIRDAAIPSTKIPGILQAFKYIMTASNVPLIGITTSDWNTRFKDVSDQLIDLHTQKCNANLPRRKRGRRRKPPSTASSTQRKPGSQSRPELKNPQKEGSSNSNGQYASKIEQKGSETSKGSAGNAIDGRKNPVGGSNDPISSTHGGSFDLWSPFRGFLLNGTEIYNKAFQFIKENQQSFKNATKKITDVYNSAVDNFKSTYNTSSIYFTDIINNITNQLNQVDIPSKSGISGNNIPQNIDQSKKNEDPPSNPTSIPQIGPTSQKQSFPQSQHIASHPPQVTIQVNSSTHKKNLQLAKSQSPDSNLKTKWNILPTTWNESVDCKPKINFINTTLVCCTYERCSLTGISVILVLIPIILSLAYKVNSNIITKYDTFKEFSLFICHVNGKKNMKSVIKFADGNRKTQIIINSYDRNKNLKPVINSVGIKKNPLLNIYKLMQTDPIPFINLFFLLIFFVYKRKDSFLEL